MTQEQRMTLLTELTETLGIALTQELKSSITLEFKSLNCKWSIEATVKIIDNDDYYDLVD